MDFVSIAVFVGFAAVCVAAASTGAKFGPDEWYRALAKPRWNPPNWLFPPAWTFFYSLLAVSGWLVWREAGFAGAAGALALYGLHLAFNAAWSPLFFGLRRIGLALIDAAAMWVTLVATIVAFAGIDRAAAWLLAPYLVWVSFAFFLNLTILRLNPGAPGANPVEESRRAE